MTNNWISVTEAIYYTGKSDVTIRRWCSEHKNTPDAFKKDKGKSYINPAILKQTHAFVIDERKTKETETKQKTEAMQIAYNSEIIKSQLEQIKTGNEQLKTSNEHIERLRNKKSYSWIFIVLGFIILIIAIGIICCFYRIELLNNQKIKISEITTFNNKIIQYKDERLDGTQKELLETKTAYQQTLKAVDLLHVKYNDKLNLKDKKIAELQDNFLNQIKINSDLKTDTELFSESSAI